MKVKVYPYRQGISMGNIIWCERDRGDSYYRVSRFAMRHGNFPPTHPCAPFDDKAPTGTGEEGGSKGLSAFRARGYWASCFPEGDGITWRPERGQDDAQCLADIRECFGWELELRGTWNAPLPEPTP